MSEDIIFKPTGSYNFYCLYEIKIKGVIFPQPIVMKLRYPMISNCNLPGQDLAETIVEHKRDMILEHILNETKASWYRLAGYCDQPPEGDDLYEETGGNWIDFWTLETKHYRPWMIMEQASDVEELMKLLEEDYNDDLRALEPVYPPVKWHAWYVTEEDYQLSTEIVSNQCVEWVEKGFQSLNFTSKYVFLNSFFEEGWQFEQLYGYKDLFSNSPLTAFYEEKSFSWQRTLKLTFYPENKYLVLHSTADDLFHQTELEFEFELKNVDDLETVVIELRYLRDVLNYDFHAFLRRIESENITVHWKVDDRKETVKTEFQKVPLGIPAGFKVVWNTFFDIQLEKSREYTDQYYKFFTEDMLLLKKTDGSKSLHLGWSSDLDLSGTYQLSHSNNVEDEEAYYENQNEDILAIIDSIHETLSIWKDIKEPEADTLVPIRVASGWEIQYNQWVKTGRVFCDSVNENGKEQLLFAAVKNNVGCIKVHYRNLQVSNYELTFQDDTKDLIKVKNFRNEEKVLSVLEEWLEYVHMGQSYLDTWE